MYLHIDFETRSVSDLFSATAEEYANDPTTEVLRLLWSVDGEPEESIVFHPRADGHLDAGRDDDLERIWTLVAEGATVYSRGIDFTLALWNNLLAPRFDWPELAVEQCRTVTTPTNCFE